MCDVNVVYFASDVNECESNNGGCQHICQNTYGSHVCKCWTGHRLDEGGKSCLGELYCRDPCRQNLCNKNWMITVVTAYSSVLSFSYSIASTETNVLTSTYYKPCSRCRIWFSGGIEVPMTHTLRI